MRNHLYNLPRWIGWQVTLFCIIDLYFSKVYFSKVYPAHTSSKLCKVIHLVEVPWLFQFSRPCLWANGSSPICVVACDTTNQHNFATVKNRNAQKCNHLWYIYASLKTFSLNRNLSTQCNSVLHGTLFEHFWATSVSPCCKCSIFMHSLKVLFLLATTNCDKYLPTRNLSDFAEKVEKARRVFCRFISESIFSWYGPETWFQGLIQCDIRISQIMLRWQ